MKRRGRKWQNRPFYLALKQVELKMFAIVKTLRQRIFWGKMYIGEKTFRACAPKQKHRCGVLKAAFLSLSTLGLPVSISAAPVGGAVTQGQATVQYQGTNTNINQSINCCSCY